MELLLRFPELKLNAEPVALPEEPRSPPRASCYDNVHDLRPLSEQVNTFKIPSLQGLLVHMYKIMNFLSSTKLLKKDILQFEV